MNVQKNRVGPKVNETHQLLAYAHDVNLLGINTESIKRNTETLTDASKEIGLEVNVEKAKYMLVSRDQNAGQNRDIKRPNRSFKKASQMKCLRTIVTNQNLTKSMRGI
jgi:hypothetical protein